MNESVNSKIYDDARTRIALSSIGFINATYDKLTNHPCAGSGTLAKINSSKGIVTAAHVVKGLFSLPSVGIVRFTGPPKQAMKMLMEHTQVITCGNPPWSKNGPDIAFMVLPPENIRTLKLTGVYFWT